MGTSGGPLGGRPLRVADDGLALEILDQTRLPVETVVRRVSTCGEVIEAITAMRVRGAPLIGVTAAYGLAFALREDPSDQGLESAAAALLATRPTAVNLPHAVSRVREAVARCPAVDRAARAFQSAGELAREEHESCRAIGDHGLELLRGLADGSSRLNVLTHCNAGWLATVAYGTALAPVYRAMEEGLDVHVWVDETRPRGQGWLTAWELSAAGVPHTVISDTMAAHLMSARDVDVVLVGTDRTTRHGDVCNKIGTLALAFAARATATPFYAAVPSTSIDWSLAERERVPLEERSPDELRNVRGRDREGRPREVVLGGEGSPIRNVAFDVTPGELVTGLITERGICPASQQGITALFPELEQMESTPR